MAPVCEVAWLGACSMGCSCCRGPDAWIGARYLDVGGTLVSGTWSSITPLRQLQYLDVRQCNCAGSLPNDLSRLIALTHLDISGTGAIGTIPSTLSALRYEWCMPALAAKPVPKPLYGCPVVPVGTPCQVLERRQQRRNNRHFRRTTVQLPITNVRCGRSMPSCCLRFRVGADGCFRHAGRAGC